MHIFHGACLGCTQQEEHGAEFCYDCCYFDSKWEKPDLSNNPRTEADIERARIKDLKGE